LGQAISNRVRGREALAVEWLAITAVILGAAARFVARPNAPLWWDESWTASIVGQQTFRQFWHMVHWDLSAPLYYFVMRPWQAVFGLSNVALRMPSLIFGVVTPLIIVFSRVAGLTRAERFTWAALLALWIPGIGYAQDARCYSLVLLLATVQTLAFARVFHTPSLKTAALWVVAADLTTMTHYDAAFLAAAQGIVFLLVKRGAAVKNWPTAFLITPAVALLAWHAPEMARYLHSNNTWMTRLGPGNLVTGVTYILDEPGWLIGLPVLAVGIFIIGRRRSPAPEPTPGAADLAWAWWAAALGAAALIVVGFIRPTVTWRYLAPFEPGAMLGLVLMMRALGRGAKHTAYLGLLTAGLAIGALWLGSGAHHGDSVYEPLNYEGASQSLIDAGTRRLVFTYDNPVGSILYPEQMAAFGGFFFRRAGAAVDVIPVELGAHDDPSVRLLKAAEPSGASILWIYDTTIPGTAAATYPPHISDLDPRWQCRDFGGGSVGIVACRPGDANGAKKVPS
jgi:hypothetical protein